MQHHRALGQRVQKLPDPRAVIGNSRIDAQLTGAQPRQLSAPAKTNQREPSGVPHDRAGGRQIAYYVAALELQHVAATLLALILVVAELDIAADAIKQRRGDTQVTGGCILVDDGADVLIDAVN